MIPTSRELVHESLPLAVVAAFWTAVSLVALSPAGGTAARTIGAVVVGAVAVVRGLTVGRRDAAETTPRTGTATRVSSGLAAVGGLAIDRRPDDGPMPVTPRALLRMNARLALGVAPWLLAAVVFEALDEVWRGVGLPGLFVSPQPALSFLASVVAVAVGLLFAVAAATTWLDASRPAAGATGDPPAGDTDSADAATDTDDSPTDDDTDDDSADE
ncbi:hypothetical protein RYH80_09070 [Halobaculum sp. MBLA0147]|uniref:hypothetical protein n=1 Tax=Halobaculum sp. MBLA0147 TaxID=3079934 RepID=UPI003523E482